MRRTPDRLLLLFHQRAALADWVRSLLAAVLGVRPGAALPPLAFQREVASPGRQPLALLEGVAEGQWVLFEQVLWPKVRGLAAGKRGPGLGCTAGRRTPGGPRPVPAAAQQSAARAPIARDTPHRRPAPQPQDVFKGGDRGTADAHDARLLRRLLYAMHGVPHPAPGAGPPPAVVTLQRKGANRRILNEAEVVDMLREFGGASAAWRLRSCCPCPTACSQCGAGWRAVHACGPPRRRSLAGLLAADRPANTCLPTPMSRLPPPGARGGVHRRLHLCRAAGCHGGNIGVHIGAHLQPGQLAAAAPGRRGV